MRGLNASAILTAERKPAQGPTNHRGVETPDSIVRVGGNVSSAPEKPRLAVVSSRADSGLSYIKRRLGRDEATFWKQPIDVPLDATNTLMQHASDLSIALRDALPVRIQASVERPRDAHVYQSRDERHLGDVVATAVRTGMIDELPVSREVLGGMLLELAFHDAQAAIWDDRLSASMRGLAALGVGQLETKLMRAYVIARHCDPKTQDKLQGEQMPRRDRAVARLESAFADDPARTLRAIKDAPVFERLAGHPRFDALVGASTPPDAPLTHAGLAELFARNDVLQRVVSYFNGSGLQSYQTRIGTEPLSEKEEEIRGYGSTPSRRGKVREYFAFDHNGLIIERVAMTGGGAGSNWFTGLAPGTFSLGGRYPKAADLAKLDVAALLARADVIEAHFHPKRAAGELVLPTVEGSKASPERLSAARRLVEDWYAAPKALYDRQGTMFEYRGGSPFGVVYEKLGVKHGDSVLADLRSAMAERLEWTKHECTYGAGVVSKAEREALIVLFAESRLPLSL